MIPFGPWRPDAAGINVKACLMAKGCKPHITGFQPMRLPVEIGPALDDKCIGAVAIIQADGSASHFSGTTTKLYKLSSTATWTDISRTSGGAYATTSGERWRFEAFGDNVIAVNYSDVPQKFSISSGVNATALGGSPPQARYIAVVRDFVVLGSLFGNERRVQWSGLNNAEQWTPGTNSSDYQDFPAGGPVRGLIGGETGYVFQSDRITRMIFAPGSAEIFQFDEIEGARGLSAQNSLVKIGQEAYYYASDGFYRFNLGSAASAPIGVGKWNDYVKNDIRVGSEVQILSAVSPAERTIVWAYVSKSNSGIIPNRIVIYDWSIDEATIADVTVEAMLSWISQGYTLDSLDSIGNLDALPYSLDSPVWTTGNPILSCFTSNHKLAYFEGSAMEATFETADGRINARAVVTGTRPHVDTTAVKVSLAARESDGQAIVYDTEESAEDTGEVPAWVSGNLVRATVRVPEGSTWTQMQGLETLASEDGSR